MTGLLLLAFAAGLLAPVNPCGFGLLPAVLTATAGPTGHQADPGTAGDAGRGLALRLGGGLRAGLALSVGFTATFTAIAVALTAGLRSVITVVPWLAAALGALLVMVGLALLAGWHPALRLPTHQPDPHAATGTRRLVAFGAGYAVASASCTIAVLLAVVTQAAAATLPGVVAVFTAYAAGSTLLLVTLAVFAAAAATLLTRVLRRAAPYASRLAGALLAASGAYLLYYWLPPLLGGIRPGDGGITALAGHTSTWISAHQLPVVGTTAAVILTLVAALTVVGRTGTTDPDQPAPGQPAPGQPAPGQPDSGGSGAGGSGADGSGPVVELLYFEGCPHGTDYLPRLRQLVADTTRADTTRAGTTPSGTTRAGTTPSGTTPSGTASSGTAPEHAPPEVRTRLITDHEHAQRERFPGSPTVRVNGRDIDPAGAQGAPYAMACRLYPTPDGPSGTPPERWILDALHAHPDEPTHTAATVDSGDHR